MEQEETKRGTNRPAKVIGWVAIAVLFILIAWLVYLRMGQPPADPARSGISELDRLYYQIGILKVPEVPVPTDAPLRDLDDNAVRLADLKGKVVFLNFWATWCPACRSERPDMEKLYRRLKDRDFAMAAVSMQEPVEKVKGYFESHGLSFRGLLDQEGEVSNQFGIISIPTTYILNREGDVIGKAVGARDWGSRDSIAFFEHLMGKAVR